MSELRRDPIGGRWVIIETSHPDKPTDFDYEEGRFRSGTCPFCYGNEAMTPPEIDSFRELATSKNSPGWKVRVVPNKFPVLQVEGDLDRRGIGIYDLSNGIGAHEILIETPYHAKDIPDLSNNEVESFISMYCRRALDLVKDKRFKYIMIFKNYGPAAGASLEHPHTQVIALPMVPKNVMEEIKGAHNYFEYRERCLFCDIIRQELQEKERVVLENAYFLAFCPFVSRFPFEVWIIPKKHSSYFCHIPSEDIPFLASILKDLVTRVKKIFPGVSYNYIIHSSPINGDGSTEGYHWHIEFMPKLTRVAGFEWGSGFYVVPTPPELAAKYLREASA
ncbi:MAG: galactose-1-phosphate uridylyltransferase [Candidatus Omnitrophica bacterium]|nr:galactose-1-phosphate uridylyltransferase [Candidatus Omnitrophota bacterium]MBU1869527.1 galactose-1-phosphate uridylyltransferase [Candidatus Omnitrophota bacterium]